MVLYSRDTAKPGDSEQQQQHWDLRVETTAAEEEQDMGPDGEGRYNRADCWTLGGTRSAKAGLIYRIDRVGMRKDKRDGTDGASNHTRNARCRMK